MVIEGIEGETQDDPYPDSMILDAFALPSIKVTPGGLDRVSGHQTDQQQPHAHDIAGDWQVEKCTDDLTAQLEQKQVCQATNHNYCRC